MFLLQEYTAKYGHVGSSHDGLWMDCLLCMEATVKIQQASASGKIFPLRGAHINRCRTHLLGVLFLYKCLTMDLLITISKLNPTTGHTIPILAYTLQTTLTSNLNKYAVAV
jgi:hypothetical protein